MFVLERTLSRLAHWGKKPLFHEGKKKNGLWGGENHTKQMENRICLQQFFDPPVKACLIIILKISRFLRHPPAVKRSPSPTDLLPLIHLPKSCWCLFSLMSLSSHVV